MAIITTDDGRSMTLPLEDHTMGELREIVREELFSDHQDTPLSLWKCTLWYESENERRVCYDSWSAQMIPTIHATIEEITVPVADRLYYWDDILQEGEECFDYLVHSMDRMIDTILHLQIDGMYRCGGQHIHSFKMIPIEEVQAALCAWIYEEHATGRLFTRELWRSFRDPDMPEYNQLGYRKLFQFQNYYLQLGIKNCVEDYHFLLRMYGKEENRIISPYDDPLLEDAMLPQRRWDLNNIHY